MSFVGTRTRRVLAALVLLLLAVVAGALAWLGPGPALWSVRGWTGGAADAAAWAHVPSGRPIVAACDVQALLSSPIAKAVRPRLDALAAKNGFDARLAEDNVRVLIVSGEGEDFAYAVASGFRLSPLLLPRVAPMWTRAPFGQNGRLLAATDGTTTLFPLEAGIVAWVPAGVDPQRVAASLEAAAASPREPVSLDDDALRAIVDVDDRLRAQLVRQVPAQGRELLMALSRVDLRVKAGDTLDVELTLSHRTPQTAAKTAAALLQINMAATLARNAGSLVALLGKDAAILAQVPPLAISQDGTEVVVKTSADQRQLEGWIDYLDAALAPR